MFGVKKLWKTNWFFTHVYFQITNYINLIDVLAVSIITKKNKLDSFWPKKETFFQLSKNKFNNLKK